MERLSSAVFGEDESMTYNYYNLAFGDWNEDEQRLDDLITSNKH